MAKSYGSSFSRERFPENLDWKRRLWISGRNSNSLMNQCQKDMTMVLKLIFFKRVYFGHPLSWINSTIIAFPLIFLCDKV